MSLPTDGFWLKVAGITSIYDYNFMVLVQETLDSRLGRSCNVAPEACLVTGPPECITLAVLLSKHQQNLRR